MITEAKERPWPSGHFWAHLIDQRKFRYLIWAEHGCLTLWSKASWAFVNHKTFTTHTQQMPIQDCGGAFYCVIDCRADTVSGHLPPTSHWLSSQKWSHDPNESRSPRGSWAHFYFSDIGAACPRLSPVFTVSGRRAKQITHLFILHSWVSDLH
jgi:hypothetical protein